MSKPVLFPKSAKLSPSAKAFVKALLRKGLQLRPTAEQCLEHSFLKPSEKAPVPSKTMSNCSLYSERDPRKESLAKRKREGFMTAKSRSRESDPSLSDDGNSKKEPLEQCYSTFRFLAASRGAMNDRSEDESLCGPSEDPETVLELERELDNL